MILIKKKKVLNLKLLQNYIGRLEMKKILYVDDDKSQIFTLKQAMENLNCDYNIDGVTSGTDCVKYLKKHKPDLIILDIMMPEISGWETYDKIKENPGSKKIPIIFLTARTDDIAKSAGTYLGNDFIEKPFDPKDLKNRIDKLIEKNK